MRKRISLLVILMILAPAVGAQDEVRHKAQSAEAAQRKTEEAQRKAQAIDILKGVVESAGEIRGRETQVAVLTDALGLLWKHDEAYARAQFAKSAAAMSDRFASDATSWRDRAEIRHLMGVLLKALARHDSKAAERLMDNFQKVLTEVWKDSSFSLGDRLSLAQAALESDLSQSIALAAKVLEAGVPASFPSYLNELEKRDPAATASLFRAALSMVANRRVYNPQHVIFLSTYVFRESEMSVPMAPDSRGSVKIEFGMFASPLSPPSRELNRILVSEYLGAAAFYLTGEVAALEQRSELDAIHVAFCFFLVKKLRGYADRLGMDRGQLWAVLDANFAMIAERAKLSAAALSGLSTMAQRIVTENTVFRFDSGDAAFAAAEKAVDPVERAEMFAKGVRELIDNDKFTEAGQKIGEVRDEKFQEQLNTYRFFRMAESSIKNLDWEGFNAQVNRVSDVRLRAYLIFSAARAASIASKKDLSSEFLVQAMALFPKIDEAEMRAAALVATAGMLHAGADASWAEQVLNEAVKAINRASRYDGGVYGVTLEAPKFKLWLPIPRFDLSHLFEQAAKRDWPGSIATAQSIESKALRSRAYIAACSTVL